jgi:hypothetical protein
VQGGSSPAESAAAAITDTSCAGDGEPMAGQRSRQAVEETANFAFRHRPCGVVRGQKVVPKRECDEAGIRKAGCKHSAVVDRLQTIVLFAINVWKLFPFVAIMVLAGLQSIPNDLYEAARVDGASFWEEVRYVMLPGVRPVIVAVTLLLVIWGLNSITIIYAITRGGPANKTLITPIQIFRLAFESVRLNQAAALSVMFFTVVIVIVIIYIRSLANESAK